MILSMKKLFFILLALSIVSCEEDAPSLVEIAPPGDFAKVASMSYQLGSPFQSSNWTVTFQYNDDDLLVRTDNDDSIDEYKLFEYNDLNRVIEVKTFYTEQNQLISRDSIVYDSNGLIASIFQFSINGSDEVVLYAENSYSYNGNGKLTNSTLRHIPTGNIWRKRKFFWDQNNISKIEDYSDDDSLDHEWTFKYDNKVSYKFNNPEFLHDELSPSLNNLVESNVVDHTGILDLACYRCTSEYTYNDNHLPLTISFNWGTTIQIEYR